MVSDLFLCAWCTPLNHVRGTHGICQTHKAEYMADLGLLRVSTRKYRDLLDRARRAKLQVLLTIRATQCTLIEREVEYGKDIGT